MAALDDPESGLSLDAYLCMRSTTSFLTEVTFMSLRALGIYDK